MPAVGGAGAIVAGVEGPVVVHDRGARRAVDRHLTRPVRFITPIAGQFLWYLKSRCPRAAEVCLT